MKSIWAKYNVKFDFIVLWAIALGFLFFYFMLSWNNRPVSEDFEFIRIFRQQGWFGSLSFSFNEHSFRLPSKIIFNLIFGGYITPQQLNYYIIIYHTAVILLLIFAVFSLIQSISNLLLKIKIKTTLALCFAILWIGSFFFGTFQVAESWFWLISSNIHLLSCVFAILGIAFILKNNEALFNYLILVISFVFVGGSSENLALFLIMLFGFFIIVFIKSKSFEPFKKIIFRKLVVSFFVVLIAFIFNLSGSGTTKRISNQEVINKEYAFAQKIDNGKMNEYSFQNIHKAFFNYKNLVALLFASSFFFMGLYLKRNKIISNIHISKPYKIKIAIAFGLVTIFVFITTVGPLYLVFGGPGPLRAWLPISMVCTMMLSFTFIVIGLSSNFKFLKTILHISTYLLLPIIAFYFFRQYPMVIKYSEAFDKRIEFLTKLEQNGNKETIDLKGLPDSGYLPMGEITEDEDYTLNKNYQFFVGIHFKVKSSDSYFSKK